MFDGFGFELSGIIDPHLNWKTACKRKARAVRRARTSFTSIIERREEPGTMPVSESEKVGVAILGQRFGDVVESIPIKKRRFLFRPPSPPILSDKTEPGLEKEGDSNGLEKEQGDCVDFSGISILAAAACNTETQDSKPCQLERENQMEANNESTSNLTEDSPSSLLIIPHNHLSAHDSASVKGSSSSSSSRDDRLHWDLNTVMEAWESPCSEEGKASEKSDLLVDPSCSAQNSTEREQHILPGGSGVDSCPAGEQLGQPLEVSAHGSENAAEMAGEGMPGGSGFSSSRDEQAEEKVDVPPEDESSAEDGEFRESFVHGWEIDEGDAEPVDYGSEEDGQTEVLESSAPAQVNVPPPQSGGAAVHPPAESVVPSSSVSADSELEAEKSCPSAGRFVSGKRGESPETKGEIAADGEGGRCPRPATLRVRSSGWDRLPSTPRSSAGDGSAEAAAPGSAFRRHKLSADTPLRRDRYLHGTRHGAERGVELGRSLRRDGLARRDRWAAAEPPLSRRQCSPAYFPQDAAAASIAKVESNGFMVAPDGTVLEAGAPPPNPPQPADLPQRFRPKIVAPGGDDRAVHSPHHRHRHRLNYGAFFRRDWSFSPPARLQGQRVSRSRSRSPNCWTSPRRRRRSRSRSRSPAELRAGRTRYFASPPRARLASRWVEQRIAGGGHRRHSKFLQQPVDRFPDLAGDGERKSGGSYETTGEAKRPRYGVDEDDFRRPSGKAGGGGDLGGRFRYASHREEKPRFGLRPCNGGGEDKSRRRRDS